jgi:G:T-mismatch repair DNA endonuclease (very short patch repair protein)
MGFHISKATLIDNKNVCPRCAEHVKPQPKPKIEPTLFKPKDSWEHRKATMQVQHSKLEMDLLTELSSRAITPHRDYSISLWSTEPDGTYPEKKLVYYVHGEPHDKGKALERDDEIKAALEKDGWNVVVFRHGEGSVKEWADQVQEALKW